MRLNVTVPDRLIERVRDDLPGVNVSGVLQTALRTLLECDHERLACATCEASVSRVELATTALDRLYRDLLAAWEPLVDRQGTAEGAARVAKSVALQHGVERAETMPLPRPTRAMREAS